MRARLLILASGEAGVVSRMVRRAEGRDMRQTRASRNTHRQTLRLKWIYFNCCSSLIDWGDTCFLSFSLYHLIIGENWLIAVIEAAA